MNQPTLSIAIKPDAITRACKALDVSRDELSRRMGVSTMAAYRVDAGKNQPSPRFIAALMSITGEPFEQLFDIRDAA